MSAGVLPAADGDVLLREEFTSLDAWRPLTFPKIERHSTYAIATNADQSEFWLKAESDRSASGVVWKKQYDVYAHPKLRWRWRVENVYLKGDATKKSGDDYPVRVYVIFQYDPATASAGKRLKYGFAKAVYGEYPPDSGLNYVWESRDNPAEYVVSPYTDVDDDVPQGEGRRRRSASGSRRRPTCSPTTAGPSARTRRAARASR